jgi:hypothetical protein
MKLVVKYFFSADVLLGMLPLVWIYESSIGSCILFEGIISVSSCNQVNTGEINLLNAKLNPSCKSQLGEFF